ncbi:Antirestriction protein ArdC [Desulfoscipio geothermicus DSM 3669]|uniref:Antirestriction protein ArdC n=1 Tax=Desulfoscipio geothermicus DSM 3669 TaxID=1121426 RepID=A0A1I6E211_9FIRM|nr:Antirestriction protein ArdC [Desulfoscipio geothermicus DSM 3669]
MTVKELYENLKAGVNDLITSGKFHEYLKFQARFHRYSFSNSMLIFMQKPDATRVAGIKTWNSMGRRVKKGEKGIRIFAPLAVKVVNDDTGDEEWKIKGFKVVTVFDVAQTEGKPLPELARDLEGATVQGDRLYSLLKMASPVPIKFGQTGPAKGYYHPVKREIVLDAGQAGDDLTSTLLHEIIHAIVEKEPPKDEADRERAEIIAEGATYVVAKYFDLDTSCFSFGYVSAWAKGDNEKLIKLGNDIQKAAAELISRVEDAQKKSKVA